MDGCRPEPVDANQAEPLTLAIIPRRRPLMRPATIAFIAALAAAAAGPATSPAASPYAGQEARDIKSLSADEIGDLLAGKGMGLAKAAELNGYPGPAHVLELRTELGLTPEQQTRTEALFTSMEADAQALGRDLVERERALDHLFAMREVSPETLSDALTGIGALQARLRNVHLQAHLDQTRLLTPEQIARYNALRGYGNGSGGTHTGHGHRHH